MEPDSYEALRRKERWYGRLMVIFFVVGIILYSFFFLYMMVTASEFYKGPVETAPERLTEFVKTMEILRIAGALGSLLATMAFFLLIYWAYLKGKRKGMESPKEKQKKKRTWKVLQPRKQD
ncbi:MAG: hypothetical protein E3J35_07760 [Methanomassiliicoccales archaeon]|nr:MAG: hypothetical protein E3J35_07760 [Methanomassiliicoccales archaeon]